MSSHSRPKGGCRHQVDQRGVVLTKSTRDSQRPKGVVVTKSTGRGLSSPSRQEVVTQSTKGVVVTKSTESRQTVDQWGCRHQVGKRSSHSRPKERGHQVNQGAGTPSQPRIGDTKSAQERGHQVSPRAGTPSQPKERGHQFNPRSGDTKSTQGAGTPSQPKVRGHQVNPRKKGRGHQVNPRREGRDTKSTHGEREGTTSQPTNKGRHQVKPRRKGGDTKSTHGKVAGHIN